MPAPKASLDLAEQLALAQARIAELEALSSAPASQPLDFYWRDVTKPNSLEADLRHQTSILEQIHDSILITDLRGIITRWNSGAQCMFGYEPNEVMGKHLSMLFLPEDRPEIGKTVFEPVLHTGKYEVELRNAERWARLSLYLLSDEAGAPYAILGVAVDITAQRQAEQALRRNEERFQLAAQVFNGVIYDWDLQTRVVHRNGDLKNILGFSADEAEPTVEWWQQRIHPEDAAKSSLHVLESLATEQSRYETEFRMRHADGHWVNVRDGGFVVRDSSGQAIRVLGFTHNVSEKKRLEQELKFQARVLATIPDPILAIDPDNVVTYFSPAAERLYGHSSAAALGRPFTALHDYAWLHPDDLMQCQNSLRERGSWSGEYIHILKDSRRLTVHVDLNTLPPEIGGGLVAVIRDVSDQKKAELESRRQSAELARANEDLRHFASVVSHDLQAPLRTIVSFSQLLGMKYKAKLDDQGADFIRLIVEAGTRMSAMVRDLLELATCAEGERAASHSASLEQALSEAIENLTNDVRASGATIRHDPLPTVTGDAGQWTQLFQNLIGNALKYRRKLIVPQIDVCAERTDHEWVISIQDNGIGFAEEEAEKIFGVFKRLHGAEYSGTGVGLAICKRIVERRGGKIWASGKPDEGALFRFSIPDEIAEPHA